MRQYIEFASWTVREAVWLTRERVLLFGSAFAFATVVTLTFQVATHRLAELMNASGEHLGTDFYTFWSGAVLAASGKSEAAYLVGPHHPFDHAMPYPPITMLICLPLSGLSYVHGFFIWLGLGLALCIGSLSSVVGRKAAVFASIGTPAALLDIFLGQTGYYTAALLGCGLMLVERHPAAAGILLGTLCCKPQLGMLVPVALAAGGHWRVFAIAAATGILLAIASAFALGPELWNDFLHRLVLQRQFMESPTAAWYWMPTVFAMTRLLGANSSAAYLAQGFSTVSAALIVAALWRRQCPLAVKSAGLVVAAFLATPYAWAYDTIVLTFAAAWLANEGIRTSFRSWEKMTALVLLVLPALAVIPAKLLNLQIAPILLWLSLAVVMRRGLDQRFPMAIAPVRRSSPPIQLLGRGVRRANFASFLPRVMPRFAEAPRARRRIK